MRTRQQAMELCAVFETWHLGDGNYPAFEKNSLVNLSFELQPAELARAPHWTPPRLQHLGGGEYTFAGQILRVYSTAGIPLAIIEACDFRFYIYSNKAAGLSPGDAVSGRGSLVLDHYIWVEYLHTYPDPPDLFYPLRVTRIQQVKTPDRFIKRSKKTLSYPTRVLPSDYDPAAPIDVDAIADDTFAHFLVHFTSEDAQIPRTFRP